MSDNTGEDDNSKPFFVDKAKQSRATCKKCKEKCFAGELRIAKVIANPFGSGKMKQWHHLKCLFEIFHNQRLTTRRIEDKDDIDGWDDLTDAEKDSIQEMIDDCYNALKAKHGDKMPDKKVTVPAKVLRKNEDDITKQEVDKLHKDNSFREFRRLVAEITNESSYSEKTAICRKLLTDGSDGSGFKGNALLWCRLLLPGIVKRIYNLQSKQLVKLFSRVLETDQDAMLEHLEQGDVSETVQHFFEKSNLTLQEVDKFLEELSQLTKEDEQAEHFRSILPRCTSNDLKVIIRLVKHDLRMNAGAKHILDAVHADAYQAFQASRDLASVFRRTQNKTLQATVSVMTPVLPMLAEACKSVQQAMKKCPNGMYSEIKYDGERVQVHKQAAQFRYYSRSLKPVLAHKVKHLEQYIPQAFPHGHDLILDSEILMIDTVSGKPLPFGSLGVHKRAEFKDANVCLFVFDCIYYNGEALTQRPMRERRSILHQNMTEIPNRVMFSEMKEVHRADELTDMIARVLREGLEGLVLKDLLGVYEPGKRHWLKVKKDYLCGGAMADSADLLVLGAWYGTGKKGGMMSVFLMGCYDQCTQTFRTVTKVHTGHDDQTLERLQAELRMTKISREPAKVPSWLRCTRTMVPDFVATDPKQQPVWEITGILSRSGAEFTQHNVHTADGLSIRFPRVTRIRDDKDWQTATSLEELRALYKNSKESTDFSHILNGKPVDCPVASDHVQDKIMHFENMTQRIKKRCSTDHIKPAKKAKTEEVDPEQDTGTELRQAPQLFQGVRLIVMPGVEEQHSSLLRSFFDRGGDTVDTDEYKRATHVVHLHETISLIPKHLPRHARNVVVNWLHDSIGNCELRDTRAYTVTWLPPA